MLDRCVDMDRSYTGADGVQLCEHVFEVVDAIPKFNCRGACYIFHVTIQSQCDPELLAMVRESSTQGLHSPLMYCCIRETT